MQRLPRTLALAVAAVSAALVLAACGDDNGSDTDTGTPAASAPTTPGGSAQPAAAFNDADVMFAQMMIPHHEQAIEMAKEAPAKASNPEVRKLAAAIEAAQAPEIARMKEWLTAWGRPATAPGGMNHGAGMMSDAETAALDNAQGAEFDRLFLTLMIAHHNGAIAMAETELAQGTHPDARTLAEQIKTSQAAEVQHMRQLLDTAAGTASPAPNT
ncbi:DUF305 domain-containing protein, partial [Yinghuangia sp. YIM S10712]|uniref:DUF305 domain-containing protein n=1 Tax=Yinghuangia sp. YIM S10712 TaxID=3436930 RepID=UPI003F53D587